jgi:hypothetical protein
MIMLTKFMSNCIPKDIYVFVECVCVWKRERETKKKETTIDSFFFEDNTFQLWKQEENSYYNSFVTSSFIPWLVRSTNN